MKFFLKLLIVTLLFAMVGCSERLETFYQTFNEAKKSGAVEKGWIPKTLPKSAVNIKEVHDLDTNMVWIRFEIDDIEDNDFLKRYTKVSSRDVKDHLPRDPRVSWWPRHLLDGQGSYSNYLFYQTSESIHGYRRVLFFGRKNGKGYIYCWSQ